MTAMRQQQRLLLSLVIIAIASCFQYPRPVYIRSVGAYLPNDPVSNEEIDTVIGSLQKSSSIRDKILSMNGIQTRYYAMTQEQQPTHLCLDLAMEAAQNAIEVSEGVTMEDIDMLATGCTLPDVLIPGFANLLHARLSTTKSMDCLSSSGVCISSTNALKAAVHAIALGQHETALVVGSETASHGLHAQHMQRFLGNTSQFSGLFLRYMLSDGAGCLLLDTSPHPTKLSFRVEAFYHHSFAHRGFPPCMVGGVKHGPGKHIELEDIWKFNKDDEDPPLRLEQDIQLLRDNILKLGKEALQYAMDHNKLPPLSSDDTTKVDWVVPHLSSMMFMEEFATHIKEVLGVEKEQIWTNLVSVGNVGAASMPLLLWGMLNNNPQMKPGHRVLVIVPESGNFSYHFFLLTVV